MQFFCFRIELCIDLRPKLNRTLSQITILQLCDEWTVGMDTMAQSSLPNNWYESQCSWKRIQLQILQNTMTSRELQMSNNWQTARVNIWCECWTMVRYGMWSLYRLLVFVDESMLIGVTIAFHMIFLAVNFYLIPFAIRWMIHLLFHLWLDFISISCISICLGFTRTLTHTHYITLEQ